MKNIEDKDKNSNKSFKDKFKIFWEDKRYRLIFIGFFACVAVAVAQPFIMNALK